MKKGKFDYQGAIQEGYSDEEILDHLSGMHPDFDISSAVEEGYSPQEINQHLSSYEPKKSAAAKSGRIVAQYGIGAAENALLPYELAVAPLASKQAQMVPYREEVFRDIELLDEKRASGDWSEQDDELYNHLVEQIKHPEKAEKFVQTADIGVRGLAEKATGLDLHPEGALEKAAGWTGFLKKPGTWKELAKTGLKPKEFLRAISPTGSEVARGIGAGASLELAEQGNFGPIGTLAAAVAGDIAGAGVAGAAKGAVNLIKNPKETLAKTTASLSSIFSKADKISTQKNIIKSFRESGIQADAGSITGNELVRMVEAKLAASGFTGEPLQKLKDSIVHEVKEDYKKLAEGLSEIKYSTSHEAGEALRIGIEEAARSQKEVARELYANSIDKLKDVAWVNTKDLEQHITKLEKSLTPGHLKAPDQKAVLDALGLVRKDILRNGQDVVSDVKSLHNTKLAISSIADIYTKEKGPKQLLKSVAEMLEKAIVSHGKEDKEFLKNYLGANKKYSEYAKTYLNKNIRGISLSKEPEKILSKMNTIQGIRDVKSALSTSPEGKELFNSLKRNKIEEVVGSNLINGATEQLNLGAFSKLLEKGNNRQVLQEILGPESFKRLERLQKNVGSLQSSLNKYYNSSKTASTATDVAVIIAGGKGVLSILTGNPWPLIATLGSVFLAKKTSALLSDPKFLKTLEDAILSSGTPGMEGAFKKLLPYFEDIRPYVAQSVKSTQENEENRRF